MQLRFEAELGARGRTILNNPAILLILSKRICQATQPFAIQVIASDPASRQLMNRGRVGLKRLQRWGEFDTEVSTFAIQAIHDVAHILLVTQTEVGFVGEFDLLAEARGHEFEELDRGLGLELLTTNQGCER